MFHYSTVHNFEEYEKTMSRIRNKDLADEYNGLKCMLDAYEEGVENSYALEIMDGFYDIVVREIAGRFVKLISKREEANRKKDKAGL